MFDISELCFFLFPCPCLQINSRIHSCTLFAARIPVFVVLAELSSDQITNLRRREALAYESDVFEQSTKENLSDANRQEKLDGQLRQLRKMISQVKVTCEASTTDD